MRKYLILLFKSFVTLYFFVIIFKRLGSSSLYFSISEVNWIGLFLSLLTIYTSLILIALRWSILVRNFFENILFKDAVGLQFISGFLNQVIPLGLAGDIYKVYFLRRNKCLGLTESTTIVFVERLIGLAVLLLISVLSSGVLFFIYKSKSYLIIDYLFFSSLLLLVLFLMVSWRKRLLLLSSPFYKINFFFGKAIQTSDYLLTVLESKKVKIFSICVCIHGLNILTFSALSLFLGIDLPFEAYLIFPIILLLSALPITIGGWGLRESLVISGLGIIGVSPDKSLLLSICYGLLLLLSYFPAIISIFRGRLSR